MKGKSLFLLLLGVSGVGKTEIIKQLLEMNDKFIYISPDMTRELRKGEIGKNSISNEEMDAKDGKGEYLVINPLYGGLRYATPKKPIVSALSMGVYPVLDWPISKIDIMTKAFKNQTHVVYVVPPSVGELKKRLLSDGRDANGVRLKNALLELQLYEDGLCDEKIDLKVVSETDSISSVVSKIYESYFTAIQSLS